jgi:hypothetical protein
VSVTRVFQCRLAMLCTLLAALPVAGCSTRVQSTGTYVAPMQDAAVRLPRPRKILVADFSNDWSRMQLDQGIAARLSRQMGGADPSAAQYRTSLDVQQAISEVLVESLRKMGMPAERAAADAVPHGTDLVIRGQIVRIDEGNRTRRLAIGFGAGKSDVQAKVQVYYLRPDASLQLLQTYDADANSGRRPGLAMGGAMAAGSGSIAPVAVSGLLGIHGETKKAGVAGEGERLADRLAYNLAQFFVQQGWIPQSAVPALSLR